MTIERIILSIDVMDRMIDTWLGDGHPQTNSMDVLEYYNWLGWDVAVSQEATYYKSMSQYCSATSDWASKLSVHTIPKNQLAFFLLSL